MGSDAGRNFYYGSSMIINPIGVKLAVAKKLDFNMYNVNVNGGAISLGHPIGASGARILVTLLHEMNRRNAQKGLATLCIGGGMGLAALFER